MLYNLPFADEADPSICAKFSDAVFYDKAAAGTEGGITAFRFAISSQASEAIGRPSRNVCERFQARLGSFESQATSRPLPDLFFGQISEQLPIRIEAPACSIS